MEQLVKIREYRVGGWGWKGFISAMPVEWTHDMHFQKGEVVTLYRGTDDRIVIVPPKRDR